jgi:Protein of unknown function (DUF3306)
MSAEPESFLARWSRRKRAAECEAERPGDEAATQVPVDPPAKPGGEGVAEAGPVSTPAPASDPAATTEVPLPPIESLDGLRSDYRAFFQQPVDDDLRHAALKKLFADPHFNQMDMLDVYVDDYTQFEPLPAALRMRLPSARAFLLDSERAALEAAEAPTGAAGNAPEAFVTDAGAGCGAVAESDAGGEELSPAADDASVESTSGLSAAGSTAPVALSDTDRPFGISSSPSVEPGESAASDPSSS